MTETRILALDYGERRMGVAVSDARAGIARPLAVITRKGKTPWPPLLDVLMRQEAPVEVVVGYPRRLDGSLGTHARAVEELASEIKERFSVKTVLWDEALTTREAMSRLAEAGRGPRARRRMVDSAAAAVILQDYLEAKRSLGA